MKNKRALFAVPYVGWMTLFVVVPIIMVVIYAFATAEGGVTLENFSSMGTYASVFTRSFWLALLATLICLLIGYPAAYFISREGPRFQRIAMMLIMLPMWMNFLLRTYSWMSVLENNGLLNQLFRNINLYFNDSEFLTLLGPSGCGKTTTLRIIGGFLTPTSGEVLFDGVRINDIPPNQRQVNTVFQRYALFPHLNVFENVAFGLRVPKTETVEGRKKKVKIPEEEIRQRVLEMLEVVSLKGFENRRITELSGGQQQRVAIARALVNRPKVLLLDEPLGALDLRLRKDMQSELKRIQQQLGITFIYVTHDQEEALAMSDTIVVMDQGRIQQIGTPEDIYNEPKNAFVADFIGESNICLLYTSPSPRDRG